MIRPGRAKDDNLQPDGTFRSGRFTDDDSADNTEGHTVTGRPGTDGDQERGIEADAGGKFKG